MARSKSRTCAPWYVLNFRKSTKKQTKKQNKIMKLLYSAKKIPH